MLNSLYIIIFAFCSFSTSLCAQSSLNVSGQTSAASNYSLEWNLGESASIASFKNDALVITTGLLQPLSQVVTSLLVYEPSVFGKQVTIGPNPASKVLKISAHFTNMGQVQIKIVDAQSALVMEDANNSISFYYNQQFEISHLPTGVYFVQIIFKPFNGVKKIGIYKILKM